MNAIVVNQAAHVVKQISLDLNESTGNTHIYTTHFYFTLYTFNSIHTKHDTLKRGGARYSAALITTISIKYRS